MRNPKQNSLTPVFFFLIAALTGCSSALPPEEQPNLEHPKFSILYSSNLNGELEPCGCRVNPTGGVGRRANWQKTVTGARISVDSGDLLFDTAPIPEILLSQKIVQAENLIEAYNLLGVQYFAPGELDFAAGLETFQRLISKAKFKALSSNLYKKNGEPLLQTHDIAEVDGIKIGLFALFSDALPADENLNVKPSLETAKEMVRVLRKKGASKIILLSHMGMDADQQLVEAVEGIDYVFGGHTNNFLQEPLRVKNTLLFQPTLRGQYTGEFKDGKNTLHEMNASLDSKGSKKNSLEKLIDENKKAIAAINDKIDKELFAGTEQRPEPVRKQFQTFPQCAQCHAPQYNFVKSTAHARAYNTLVKVQQNKNMECLKCHTVGQGEPGGYANVKQLVLDSKKRSINAEDFSKSLPNMTVKELVKTSKAFINVQCESCHGRGDGHPAGKTPVTKISFDTCLKCHTPERAPSWHKNGSVDAEFLLGKMKLIACPKIEDHEKRK